MNEVADIYNQLFSFESKRKLDTYPIHKRLNLGEGYDDLLDWITSKVTFDSSDRVLDAGCGTGYSLIRLAKEKGVKGTGISLSEKEVAFARSIVANERLESKISFEQTSFDDDLKVPFDKIIAIESLKHSENLVFSIKNLVEHTSDQGTFIIADDFLVKSSARLDKQKQLWKAPSLVSVDEFEEILNHKDQFQIHAYDFTNKVIVRNVLLLRLLMLLIQMMLWFSKKNLRISLEIYLGGLLLEYLYCRGIASYQIIIATKRPSHDKT